MAKKRFKIREMFLFNRQVIVAAHSRQEAEAIAEKGSAGQFGRVDVQPTAEDNISDWDFSINSEIVINRK